MICLNSYSLSLPPLLICRGSNPLTTSAGGWKRRRLWPLPPTCRLFGDTCLAALWKENARLDGVAYLLLYSSKCVCLCVCVAGGFAKIIFYKESSNYLSYSGMGKKETFKKAKYSCFTNFVLIRLLFSLFLQWFYVLDRVGFGIPLTQCFMTTCFPYVWGRN